MQTKRPTIMDVARQASVSRATASRVLNGGPGVAPDVRQRVQQVIDDLDYHPDPAAQALASGRSELVELVELIVVDENPSQFGRNVYYGRVVGGIVNEIATSRAQMRVHIVSHDEAPGLLAKVARAGSLGAILVNVPPAMAADFHTQCDRVVSLGRSAPGVPSVETDNAAGAYAAVHHLQLRGRRRIAGIHGPQTSNDAVARREGYLFAMRDAGLPAVSGAGTFCREAGYLRTRELLVTHTDLDAVFVACDLMATGTLQALAEAGRRVPDDVAVVGYDDSVIAACASPPMTSVHQPVEEMAAAATRALLDRRTAPFWRCELPSALVIRQSSG
jgi:DNA-binding LacI/PurR family transcriptional regulator